MSSPTLRQIFKFPGDVKGLKFAPAGASIAFLVKGGVKTVLKTVLMVFYKHSSGLFVPSYKNILEVAVEVKDLKWMSPNAIEYSPNQRRINLKKHRERFLEEFGDVAPENYTVCHDHWKSTRKCQPCGENEAQYSEHEARTTIRDEKDGKFMAKILDQGFVEIWSFGNDSGNEMLSEIEENPTKKRRHESEPNDSSQVKQAKFESPDKGSDLSVPASSKGRALESIVEVITSGPGESGSGQVKQAKFESPDKGSDLSVPASSKGRALESIVEVITSGPGESGSGQVKQAKFESPNKDPDLSVPESLEGTVKSIEI